MSKEGRETPPWVELQGDYQKELEDAKRLEGGGPDYKYQVSDVFNCLDAHGPDSPSAPDRNIAPLFKKNR